MQLYTPTFSNNKKDFLVTSSCDSHLLIQSNKGVSHKEMV